MMKLLTMFDVRWIFVAVLAVLNT